MQASPIDTKEKAFASSSFETHFDTMLRITIVIRPENICTTAPAYTITYKTCTYIYNGYQVYKYVYTLEIMRCNEFHHLPKYITLPSTADENTKFDRTNPIALKIPTIGSLKSNTFIMSNVNRPPRRESVGNLALKHNFNGI